MPNMPINFTHFVRPTAQSLRALAAAYWQRYALRGS